MLPFSDVEMECLIEARANHPKTPQRQLARLLCNEYNAIGQGLRNRSEQAIYGALRRYDASLKKGRTLAGQAISDAVLRQAEPCLQTVAESV